MFQIAAHKSVVPLPTLYEWSRIARRLLIGPHNVGRVIARPFEGEPNAFVRSPERRDFSVPPPGPTILDRLQEAEVAVLGVGKIQDIFSGQGITRGALLGLERPRGGSDARVPRESGPGLRVREPRRLRLEVRSPERSFGLRSVHRGLRPAPPRTDRWIGRGSDAHHGRSRVRSRRRRPRTIPASEHPSSRPAWREVRTTSARARRSATWDRRSRSSWARMEGASRVELRRPPRDRGVELMSTPRVRAAERPLEVSTGSRREVEVRLSHVTRWTWIEPRA